MNHHHASRHHNTLTSRLRNDASNRSGYTIDNGSDCSLVSTKSIANCNTIENVATDRINVDIKVTLNVPYLCSKVLCAYSLRRKETVTAADVIVNVNASFRNFSCRLNATLK